MLIRQTDTHPLVQMTAHEFMFGYESTLLTLGNHMMPNWIKFEKLGLIDRVRALVDIKRVLIISKVSKIQVISGKMSFSKRPSMILI